MLRVEQHQQPAGSGCGSAGDRGNGCHGCLQLGWGNQPMRRKSQRLSVLMLDGWYWLLPKLLMGRSGAAGFSVALQPTDTAGKTCAGLSHGLVGCCRQGQSIRGSLHQWPRSFRCFLADLQVGWIALSSLTIFAAAWLIKRQPSKPSTISCMSWCFAC